MKDTVLAMLAGIGLVRVVDLGSQWVADLICWAWLRWREARRG